MQTPWQDLSILSKRPAQHNRFGGKIYGNWNKPTTIEHQAYVF